MVIWTAHAVSQLRHLHQYIAQDSKLYAQRVSQALASRATSLEAFPFAGRVVPELKNPNIREVPVYSYRLLYEVRADCLAVLAIIHKRRSLEGDAVLTTR